MKIFKIIAILVAILGLTLISSGCENKNIEGSLEEIMGKLYIDIPENERPMMLSNTEVTDENIEYYLGTKNIEFTEALASEPGIGSIAHSVVLIRTKNDADVDKIKKTISESIDPRKWICVGVEEDDVIIENKGDLIIVIMIEDATTRDKIKESFDKLK